MLKFIKNLFKGSKQQCNIHDVSVSVAGTCNTCRFADREKDMCTAGTYWAEKGQNKICYGGELWEATERQRAAAMRSLVLRLRQGCV